MGCNSSFNMGRFSKSILKKKNPHEFCGHCGSCFFQGQSDNMRHYQITDKYIVQTQIDENGKKSGKLNSQGEPAFFHKNKINYNKNYNYLDSQSENEHNCNCQNFTNINNTNSTHCSGNKIQCPQSEIKRESYHYIHNQN